MTPSQTYPSGHTPEPVTKVCDMCGGNYPNFIRVSLDPLMYDMPGERRTVRVKQGVVSTSYPDKQFCSVDCAQAYAVFDAQAKATAQEERRALDKHHYRVTVVDRFFCGLLFIGLLLLLLSMV